MPLHWTIDSKERLFTCVGEGEVGIGDVLSLFDVLVAANALSYRKLFDTRAAQSTMTGEDVLAVCARARACHAQARMGALAMVATAEQTLDCARLLGVLAAADRPMKMFDGPREARLWLNRQTGSDGVRPGRMGGKRRPNLRPGRR